MEDLQLHHIQYVAAKAGTVRMAHWRISSTEIQELLYIK